MLDNLPTIPKEAFTAAEHIIVKMIDKISNAVGWSITPKGNKAYQIEAEEFLIGKIKETTDMPELAKAACISKARKIIKEYQRQNNICLMALKFLDNTANPDSVDNDWLIYFFEHAKNIDREEMAVIWSQILAREMNVPNDIPKSLIYILSVIDYEDAASFKKLADISLQIGELYYPVVFMGMSNVYEQNQFSSEDIIRLQSTNLIQYAETLYHLELDEGDNIVYFDSNINIGNVRKICVGNVVLSKAGQALMSVITDKRKLDGFEEYVKEIIIKEDGGIFDDWCE